MATLQNNLRHQFKQSHQSQVGSSHRLRPSFIVLTMKSSAILRKRKAENANYVVQWNQWLICSFLSMDLGSTKVVEIVTNYFFIMMSLHNLRKQGNRKKITKKFQIRDPLS